MSGSPARVSSSVADLTGELVEARRENAVLRQALAVSEARVALQVVKIEELSGLVQSLSAQVAEPGRRLGVDSSNSSVDRRLHDLLDPFEQQIKYHLAGTDETPVSLAGEKAYLYTFHNGRIV